ncbi:alpha-(1,3)-fucosyltransferase C-like [Dermacentor variabilis]|uniref:alpha-(1,3)-fucosyltransferase C-like n=1 Tax=Dermacentor variabilis TaxID=34621 RepID=UPI003F5B2226
MSDDEQETTARSATTEPTATRRCFTSRCLRRAAIVVLVAAAALGILYVKYVPSTATEPLSYWYHWRERPPSVGFTYPRIFLWTGGDRPPTTKDQLLRECLLTNPQRKQCYVTKDPVYHVVSDAIVIEASRMDPYNLPRRRHPEQVWVYSTVEGEPATPPSWPIRLVSGVFNWTMSRRDDADVVVPYMKWHYRLKDIVIPREPLLEAIDAKTKSVAWFVSKCEEPLRNNTERFQHYPLPLSSENFMIHINHTFDVFMFTDCGRPLCNSLDQCMQMVAEDFYFVFVLETSPCFHHPTEMIYAAFHYNIVPVYFGKTSLGDSVPPGSVYDTSGEQTAFDIVDKLNIMRDNVDAYLPYLTWKETYEETWESPLCALCDVLYASAANASATADVLAWWRRRPECDYVIPSPGAPITETKITPYGMFVVPDELADIRGRIRRPPKVRRTTTSPKPEIPNKNAGEDSGHSHDDIL